MGGRVFAEGGVILLIVLRVCGVSKAFGVIEANRKHAVRRVR